MEKEIFYDALFAAIAAIGFASISRLPLRAYVCCAALAAVGHSLRFVLMGASIHIVGASLVASTAIGVMAVFLSPLAHTPAEACFLPSLLPMIPGIYAYRSLAGLAMCTLSSSAESFAVGFYRFGANGLVCAAVLTAMVAGATLPVLIFNKISFRATR